MEHKLATSAARMPRARSARFRGAALAVILVAAALVAWLALRDGSSTPKTANATRVSVAQLATLAASVGHPIFWVGPRQGVTYELTRTVTGSIFVRYLPAGVAVGSDKPYLTVATYPFPGALAAIRKVAQGRGVTSFAVANGGMAELSKPNPRSVHVAYPNVDYQVEVYSPVAGAARALVASGKLTSFGKLSGGAAASAPQPRAVSAGDLRALAASLGHPLYWAGPRSGDRYELTRTASGSVFVRYLPAGAAVGTSVPYLTVATYPFPGAYGALQALARQSGVRELKLSGGGIAVVDQRNPKSIHLAFPGSPYQVEVFAPSPRQALRVVTAGEVSSLR
jgi:hypothetical protein